MDTLGLFVLSLVCMTGVDNFRTREITTAKLAWLAEFCPQAIFAGEQSSNPETAARCKTIGNQWYARHADELSKKLPLPCGLIALPFICRIGVNGDGAHTWMWDYESPYLAAAKAAGFKDESPHWPAWSEATRLWMRDRIAARLSTADILNSLAPHSRQWLEKRND